MGLWLKQDGELVSVSGGSTGADGADGADGKGWTGGSYDPETGTVTFTSDDGLEFTTGDLRGTDGIDGLDGNMWHVGSGPPDSTLGADGDYYLDGTDGWVWIKRSSGWTNLWVNLTGPPGDGGGGGGDYLPLTGGTLTGDLQVNGNTQSWSIKNGNGNLSAPSYSFYNDPTTGLFRQAEGVLGVAGDLRAFSDLQVGGVIKAKGNGGQGAPSYGFDGDTEGLGLYGSTGAGSQWLRLTADGVWRVQIDAAKVTVRPDLQVDGNLVSTSDLYVEANGAEYRFMDGYLTSFPATGGARLRADAAGDAAYPTYAFFGDADTGIYRAGTNSIGFATAGIQRLQIGTTHANFGPETGTGTASIKVNAVGDKSQAAYAFRGDLNTGMYRKAANKIGFSASGNEIAYVATDGIHLASSTTNGHWYRIDGNKGGWYCAGASTGMWVGGNGSWVTNYGSNAGIGSTTGMYGGLMPTTGTSGFQYIMRSTSLSSFSYYTSSAIYKDRITTQSVSSDFDKLRPVTFIEAAPKGRSEPEEARAWRLKAKEFGFIAEEIAELYDGHLGQYEAVDGKLKPVGFSWPGLISVTVKEVQDLRKRVAANEATIASLVERIEALEGNK